MLNDAPMAQEDVLPDLNMDQASSGSPQRNFLTIKEVNTISRARTLRLNPGDVIIGTDGQLFTAALSISKTSWKNAMKMKAFC